MTVSDSMSTVLTRITLPSGNRALHLVQPQHPREWLPEGRYEFEGRILTVKEVWSQFGYPATVTYKLLIQLENGNKVFGSLPRSVPGNVDSLRGKLIRMTARVERSKDDPLFGFYSRPTKTSLVAATEKAS